MQNAQSVLRGMQAIPSYHDANTFLMLVIMATNSSAEIDGEQHEFLTELVRDLISRNQTTAAEARNTATWLNTFRRS